jgi:hypothetical protein
MNATVKLHYVKKIEDNGDRTVTIHYTHSLTIVKAMQKMKGQEKVKWGTVYTMVVEKGQLVDLDV